MIMSLLHCTPSPPLHNSLTLLFTVQPSFGCLADEADRYRHMLINTLLATFPKYLTPANLRVKALPAGNRNIIVAVKRGNPSGGGQRAAAGDAVYIVDVTALSQEEVHRRLKESDSFFECDYQHCACLPIALEVRWGAAGLQLLHQAVASPHSCALGPTFLALLWFAGCGHCSHYQGAPHQ